MQRPPQLPAPAHAPRRPQRDLALGLGSLLLHALLLVLVPGLALPEQTPARLLINLVQPEVPSDLEIPQVLPVEAASKPMLGLDTQLPAGMGARSLDPQDGQAAVRRSSPGSNPNPSRPKGAAGEAVPKNDPAAGPPLSPLKEEAAPTAEGETTEVVRPAPVVKSPPPKVIATPPQPQKPPVAVPPAPEPAPREDEQTPEAKQAQGSAQPQAKPKTKRQASKNAAGKSAKSGTKKSKKGAGQPQGRPDVSGAPGVAKPAPETGKPDPNPNSGSGSGPSPNPGNGSGNTPGAPDGSGPEGRTAPDFGAPALPKGPGDGELAILGQYGDHCMNELRKMARNPEKAREKFKGQADDWGTVTFEFEVTKTGKLLSVKILNNGGFAPFGEEVAESMRICGRSGKFGPWSRFGSVPSVDSWTFKRKLKFPLY